ncbi:MAG: hypothetical protein GY833_18580 [Aestuariibacter sp.]|nr:hypothetical protein [Aestuariibacter sp.]
MAHSMLLAEAAGNIVGSVSGITVAVGVSRTLDELGAPKVVSVLGGAVMGGAAHLITDYVSTAAIATAMADPITLAANNATSPIETLLNSPLIFLASALGVVT